MRSTRPSPCPYTNLRFRCLEDETYTYDTRRGLVTRVFGGSGEAADEARREATRSLRESAEENGILAQAEQNAEDSVRAFLTSLEFEEVAFE